jgi:hypothetical protein
MKNVRICSPSASPIGLFPSVRYHFAFYASVHLDPVAKQSLLVASRITRQHIHSLLCEPIHSLFQFLRLHHPAT